MLDRAGGGKENMAAPLASELPGEVQPKVQRIQKWVKPAPDVVKINIDAAFSGVSQPAGWGCIARDHAGDVFFAAAGVLEYMCDALHAEACALLHAVRFAQDHGMGRVAFETDCLVLQQAINSETLDRSSLGAVFRELKYLLELGFIKWNVPHCPRVCNVPAHELAALGGSGVLVFMETNLFGFQTSLIL
ncbi:hypothetical protein ZWY2020_038640 [Hordeum vulgare]|nr:hypothetical protein ZWY2020_038640 [Hordeum vulgare]